MNTTIAPTMVRPPTDLLTKSIRRSLATPLQNADFDLHAAVGDVLKDVGLSPNDGGGKLTFYGRDPIIPSVFRFGGAAAIGLAAKAVAVAAIWRFRTGEGQDIAVDVRKALRRFAGFLDLKWETINGRSPALDDPLNPFIGPNLFRETKDGRHVVAINIYPRLAARAFELLGSGASAGAVSTAIRGWRAEDLENAAADAGLPIAMVRTFDEFQREPQYTEVLSKIPLISVEKVGESEPMPFEHNPRNPLDGVRALGMGHVIAGGAVGRDLAFYGADVLNVWRPLDTEIEAFFWDVQVGMRSTILGYSAEDRAQLAHLLRGADVFFSNKRPGYLERHGLDAETLVAGRPGLVHARVVAYGDEGPWKNRVGFDETGAAVAGLFAVEGTPAHPHSPPVIPIVDNVVGWFVTVGVLAALRRRAAEGGSYKVTVSLTRTVLWLLSLGAFDKAYAQATAGSSDEHAYVAPDLFTAETPLGTYQGVTDQTVMSRTPGSFRTVIVPRGSSKPEWLERR
jgi:crotonobetainyl-CoA:carnitine CoA-transferase CaiB-like acyl-CoA transferase